VRLHLGDSAAPESLDVAVAALGGMPQLILLDSSHQYEHTLRELDLWVPRMEPGTIMLLHDVSVFAQTFDTAGAGGVQQALDDWLPRHPEAAFLSLNREVTPGSDAADLVYKDGCGLGILQRRA
jgi:cephalosporin hydroxylase